MDAMNNSADYILETIKNLGVIQEADILLETALTQMRKISGAEAGTIYVVETSPNDRLELTNRLRFQIAQNDALEFNMLDNYKVFTVPIDENSISGYVALTKKSLTINDVHELPETCPYRPNLSFDSFGKYRTVSTHTIPLRGSTDNELLGVLQLINAKDEESGEVVPFRPDLMNTLEAVVVLVSISLERSRNLLKMLRRTITMTELRDPSETAVHINRVARYATTLFELWALKHQMSSGQLQVQKDILHIAALAHDVGKIGISDTILGKPGKLTEDEFQVMKKHTVIGHQIFNNMDSIYDKYSALVALRHHEKWDGTGYPGHIPLLERGAIRVGDLPLVDGLKGEEIPFFARIVAISDVFDALASRRVYKEAWTQDRVKEVISSERGKHFDPELLDLFITNFDVFYAIRDMLTETS